MSLTYIEIADGIQADHQEQAPLLERVYCAPGKGACENTRLYSDGSYYMLTPPADGLPLGKWMKISQLNAQGMKAITDLLGKMCAVKSMPERHANDEGSETLRIHTGDCDRELLITGVPSGPFQALGQLSTLINGSLGKGGE